MFEKYFVQHILENPLRYDKWTVQGFGMLRLHLSDQIRLNVWDSALRYSPAPSMIHDHPWNFVSMIVVGRLWNQRYFRSVDKSKLRTHEEKTIRPGMDFSDLSDVTQVRLVPAKEEFYANGMQYTQGSWEIHESKCEDGTVTVNARKRVGDDQAHVFWALGDPWVTALPRPAHSTEILATCERSLKRWFTV